MVLADFPWPYGLAVLQALKGATITRELMWACCPQIWHYHAYGVHAQTLFSRPAHQELELDNKLLHVVSPYPPLPSPTVNHLPSCAVEPFVHPDTTLSYPRQNKRRGNTAAPRINYSEPHDLTFTARLGRTTSV